MNMTATTVDLTDEMRSQALEAQGLSLRCDVAPARLPAPSLSVERDARVRRIAGSQLAPVSQCGGCGRFVPEGDLFACVEGDLRQGLCGGCFIDPRPAAKMMLPMASLFPDINPPSLEQVVRGVTGKSMAEIRRLPVAKPAPVPAFATPQAVDRDLKRMKKTNWSWLLVPVIILMVFDAADFTFSTWVAFLSTDDFSRYYHQLDPLWKFFSALWQGIHLL
jgi:hypothetical protein